MAPMRGRPGARRAVTRRAAARSASPFKPVIAIFLVAAIGAGIWFVMSSATESRESKLAKLHTYREHGLIDKALFACRKEVFVKDEYQPDFYLQMYILLAAKEKYDEARPWLERVKKEYPDYDYLGMLKQLGVDPP